jgi:hypothetical protein
MNNSTKSIKSKPIKNTCPAGRVVTGLQSVEKCSVNLA